MNGKIIKTTYNTSLTLRFIDDSQKSAIKTIIFEIGKSYHISFMNNNRSISEFDGKMIGLKPVNSTFHAADGFIRDSLNTYIPALSYEDDTAEYFSLMKYPKKNYDILFDTSNYGGGFELINLYSIRDVDII